MDLINFIAGLLSGLISGVVVGYVIEHYRLKNGLKIERIKRLMPHIEVVHPIVEELRDDLAYLQKTQTRTESEDDPNFMQKICRTLDKYGAWYTQFQSNGLKPELGATNKELFAYLNGLSVHSKMAKKYGQDYVLREINQISKSARVCVSMIEQFLRS